MAINPFLVGNIPGNSLTVEPGSVPWENPPKLVTVEEAVDHYVENMSNPNVIAEILGALKRGAPILSLVNVITKFGVMKGLHTVHVGFLITPIIVEIIKTLAEVNKVKYVVTNDEKTGRKTISPTALRELIDEVKQEIKNTPEAVIEENPTAATEKRGLMARGENNGI